MCQLGLLEWRQNNHSDKTAIIAVVQRRPQRAVLLAQHHPEAVGGSAHEHGQLPVSA
jgi:hypothetical protein